LLRRLTRVVALADRKNGIAVLGRVRRGQSGAAQQGNCGGGQDECADHARMLATTPAKPRGEPFVRGAFAYTPPSVGDMYGSDGAGVHGAHARRRCGRQGGALTEPRGEPAPIHLADAAAGQLVEDMDFARRGRRRQR
jgi:hypothetical protein